MSFSNGIVKNFKTEKISHNASGTVSSNWDKATDNLIISNLNAGGSISIIADNITIKPKSKMILSTGKNYGGEGDLGAILTGYGEGAGCRWTPYMNIPEFQQEKTITDGLMKKLTDMEKRILELEAKLSSAFDFDMAED